MTISGLDFRQNWIKVERGHIFVVFFFAKIDTFETPPIIVKILHVQNEENRKTRFLDVEATN